jgi:hypothetical protein
MFQDANEHSFQVAVQVAEQLPMTPPVGEETTRRNEPLQKVVLTIEESAFQGEQLAISSSE